MPTYVSLMKWTAKGVESIEEAPQRTAEAIKSLESMGGKLIGFYYLMGEYDMVGIAEAPSDEVALAFLAGLSAQGNVRTTTMRAFTPEEAGKIMAKLASA
jgi:uncharacterized protein with GYD domain